ncbi:MAG: Crp/Fnr family transcriptional regulator [Reyranella sp.]|uniref:Crp/Fnr family transcriptional regulator n=1 Tax=Reyranella sp. TaxID=1929291 RepID=UPI003D0D6CFC
MRRPSARGATTTGEGTRLTAQELVRRHPFFPSLAPAESELLLRHIVVKRAAAGQILFHREQPGDGLYAILSGRIAFTVGSPEGKELILNVLGPGEFFGEIALLDGKGRSASAVARDPSELAFIGRVEFLDFLGRRPETMLRIIELLCARLRRATDYIEDSTFLDLPARLSKSLLSLVDGRDRAAGAIIRISQEELAAMLGVSRERVNRQLAVWCDLGILEQRRGRVVVRDESALARMANGMS